MDATTLFGIIFGLAALLGGFLLEGGTAGSLLQLTAFIIVVGGTFGATIASYPLADLKRVPQLLKIAFSSRGEYNLQEKIAQLVEYSQIARREGLLALENRLDELNSEPYARRGLELVIDGVESEVLRQMMELELTMMEQRHAQGARIFESAGGFAPTMGIIGTVMGLVHVLSNITSPDELAHGIAVAFMATLYGIMTANLIYIPIANKLREKSRREIIYREMLIEGILAIQSGENPKNLEQKLMAFVVDNKKEKAAQPSAQMAVEAE